MILENNREIAMAGEWILRSGIQNTEGARAGGFNAWYDPSEKNYSYVYSEITGYGITTLLYLEELFGDEECLDRAIAAADWLMSEAVHPSGGVKTRDYYGEMDEADRYSFDSGNIYAFDNGMVLYGAVNLFRRTEDRKYLDFARSIADFMIEKMGRPGGLFFAIFNAGTGATEDAPWRWSSQSGSYHAKLALGFSDLFDATGDKRYRETGAKLCRKCIEFQESSGRFRTSRADNSTHLHPHCYSAEGLLYAGMHFGEEEFIASAVSALRWALDNSRSDGGVPKLFNGKDFLPYYRSDTLAQVLRLGVILYGIGRIGKEYVPALEMLRERLLSYQFQQETPQKGGFIYGTALDGSEKRHLNSWCTMFALQALIMYEDIYVNGKEPGRLERFV